MVHYRYSDAPTNRLRLTIEDVRFVAMAEIRRIITTTVVAATCLRSKRTNWQIVKRQSRTGLEQPDSSCSDPRKKLRSLLYHRRYERLTMLVAYVSSGAKGRAKICRYLPSHLSICVAPLYNKVVYYWCVHAQNEMSQSFYVSSAGSVKANRLREETDRKRSNQAALLGSLLHLAKALVRGCFRGRKGKPKYLRSRETIPFNRIRSFSASSSSGSTRQRESAI